MKHKDPERPARMPPGRPASPRTWFHSVAGGITLVTAAVAILAVLVTGLVAFPLIRSATVDSARQQLARQADAYAAAPAASRALDVRERALLGPDTYKVSTITVSGTVKGIAGQVLGPAEIGQVLAGQNVSRTLSTSRGQLLVEARALKHGGGIVLTRSLQDVDAESAQLLARTLLALAIGLLIAVLAGTLLARRLSQPLVRTAAAARRIAAGQRTVELAPSGMTEVREMGEAINTLDEALMASEDRQHEFLLSISHEIRTPLTAVRGYAEAMVDGLVPPEDVARVGQVLAAETDRLDGFVRELLALARLEAEDFALEIGPVDVAVVLKQVREAWNGAAEQARVPLQLRLLADGDTFAVTTDGQRLRQIIDALVGNALRVTPAGKPLVIEARLENSAASPTGRPDVVAVEVRDNGPGLTAQDAAVAFERGVLFRRYAGQRPVGSGLGLSIAARLAQRLGLRLTVEPAAPDNDGACFCIRLPRSPHELTPQGN
ncbi:HAMP domain-containing sensor histidine kinase [Arthrobacter sp. LAPM80]|uniref:sensor histidine kinase n=1 Tax=Arthrobacter sp. LAPM80 TaxID=3141788 RepID=UPI00398A587C